MKKIIDLLKKVDTFIDVWSHKVPFLIFDLVVILIASILSIGGFILVIIGYYLEGILYLGIIYAITIYLLMKRHKKHIEKWTNS